MEEALVITFVGNFLFASGIFWLQLDNRRMKRITKRLWNI